MSGNQKMMLKLNTTAARDAPADSPTPATAGGLKLNLKKSNTPATASETPKKTSAAKAKATPKKAGPTPTSAKTKKRAREDGDNVDGSAAKKARSGSNLIRLNQTPLSAKPPSLIRLQSNKTPSTPTGQTRIKIKAKGKIMPRPDGVGYDSEASDAEEDPVMQDNFILRMPPGRDCDLIRQAIESKTIHLPASAGGPDVHMKFFTKDGRRCAIFVQDRIYAAVLVDLPCIIESMKSWDKKSWMKSADVCQMMMVLGRSDSEDAAKTFPLPRPLDAEKKLYDWPHGLTPPMYNVRKRRFRRRVNVRTIEAAEERVEELLRKDEETRAGGGKTNATFIDPEARWREEEDAEDSGVEEDQEDDAEGDYDEDMAEVEVEVDEDEEDDEDHEASIARALGEDLEAEFEEADGSTPAVTSDQDSGAANTGVGTPGAAETPATNADTPSVEVSMDDAGAGAEDAGDAEEDEDEDDDDEDDESDDDEEEIEEDDATRERAQYVAQTRDEIENLKEKIAQKKAEEASKTSVALKARIQQQIKSLQEDLAVKKRDIGDADEDDEDGD